ncbi:MAG: Flp pilus assembly protein TadB [Phycisphaerales bacterium]|nr:Flp pilus assembly protein TadB [Phycisphaerales bacterium]
MEELFPILVALCVAIFAWGLCALVLGIVQGDKRKLTERLSGKSGSTGAGARAASIVMQVQTKAMPALLARSAFMRSIHRQLVHAHPEASLLKFLALSIGLSVVAGVVFLTWMESPWVALAAAGAGAYLPYMMVVRKKNKRQRRISEQLPEALDFLQRILRAGHSLSTGLSMMADELPQPLAGEFRRCYDEHSLGQPLEECLRDMVARIESTDFAFFVTAVLIQRQTGGDLSALLGNISGMIRQRIRLQQYVKAKTAEGRFTGYILVCFPVLMFFIASSMNPDYKKNLLGTSTGLTMLGIAAGLVVLGLVTIRKITTVRV